MKRIASRHVWLALLGALFVVSTLALSTSTVHAAGLKARSPQIVAFTCGSNPNHWPQVYDKDPALGGRELGCFQPNSDSWSNVNNVGYVQAHNYQFAFVINGTPFMICPGGAGHVFQGTATLINVNQNPGQCDPAFTHE